MSPKEEEAAVKDFAVIGEGFFFLIFKCAIVDFVFAFSERC